MPSGFVQDVYLQNVIRGDHPLRGGSPRVPDHEGVQRFKEKPPPDAAAGTSADAGLAQHVHHAFLGASVGQRAIWRVQKRRLHMRLYSSCYKREGVIFCLREGSTCVPERQTAKSLNLVVPVVP